MQNGNGVRIAAVADVHVGNPAKHGGAEIAGINDRGLRILETLGRSYKAARSQRCSAFVVAGDLADVVNLSPQLETGIQEQFAEADELCPVYVLRGNHDMNSVQDGDHALGPLAAAGCVFVVETASHVIFDNDRGKPDLALLMVPFEPGPAKDWLGLRLAELFAAEPLLEEARQRVLCVHLGIVDADTPPWLREADDAVTAELLRELSARWRIDGVLAGNWHKHKLQPRPDGKGPVLCQIGALCPVGWKDPGLDGYGGVCTWDTEAGLARSGQLSTQEIPGPRFLQVELDAAGAMDAKLLDYMENVAEGTALYLQIKHAPGQAEAARALLAGLQKDQRVVAGECHVSAEAVSEAVRSAAKQAGSAASLAEAADAWVGEYPMPDDVTRADVSAEIHRRLKL